MLEGMTITHVYSSELYGESVAIALNAKHILVDLPRNEIRISGTEIRKNPKEFKSYMDTLVYQSFISYL